MKLRRYEIRLFSKPGFGGISTVEGYIFFFTGTEIAFYESRIGGIRGLVSGTRHHILVMAACDCLRRVMVDDLSHEGTRDLVDKLFTDRRIQIAEMEG